MMKKRFLTMMMVLLGLFAGAGSAWAGIEQIVGSLDVENPGTWFYVNLNAQVSNPGCGTTNPGQVWLLHTQAEPTDKLDNDGNWTCLLDENGDPVPDPQMSGSNPWLDCLHLQSRKAINPWITNNPKPAKPKNPYRNAALFTIGYSYGKEAYDAKQSEETYPTDENWTEEDMVAVRAGYDLGFVGGTPINPYSVLNGLFKTGYDAGKDDKDNERSKTYPTDESWTAEENSIVRAGYDDGYDGAAYNNPYWFGYEAFNLMGDWDDYFRNGLRNAQDGESKNEPKWMEWGLPRYWATLNGYNAGYDWYHDWYTVGHYLNVADPVGAAKPTVFAPSVSLKGTALIYAPGFEDTDLAMAYVSTYAYFYGKVQENDGWYFTGWSFTEGESDLGGVIAGSAENDSIELRVLPASTAGEANIRQEYVYATFQPVRVSDYKVNGLINTSVSNSTTIVFDVVGERVSEADFMVSEPEANFSAEITSCENNKVTVTVTYSGEVAGEFSWNVTLASKSGCSQLTAPVYARVGDDASNEATLYDGKTPTSTSGTLQEMIAAANNSDKIVVLNKNYASDLTVNAKVTINLNGYTIQDLEVTGGELTIAYSKYGSNGEDISVTGGKLILNGGDFASLTVDASGIVEQNGATITGASENHGILVAAEGRFEAGFTSDGTLTIDGGAFEGTTAITVSGGTANINKATINGTSYGIQATGGITNITSKLVSVYGGSNAVKQSSTGTVNLTNGKFVGETAPLAGTVNLQAGYFKVDGANIGISVPEGKKVLNVLAGIEFAEGYRYFVGDDASSVGVCRIGTTSYTTLEDALAYANNTGETVTIIMTNDYTLPAGYYTLPATATLIVPMSNEQEAGYPIVNRVSNNSASSTAYVQPYEFRCLTFAKGVNLDVHGTIELTGTQRASDDAYAAMPHGPYGHLLMEDGSHMTLQNGSLLRAWGYMTGKGETDARRGSVVREQFQMGDWKGGLLSFQMLDTTLNPGRVFPISQYFIQNIESPVKYHPGATLSTTTSVSAAQGGIGITAMANDIIVVGVSGGDPAMFFMDQEADAENTWVRKWYDAENDVQTYDVNSGAHIGSMVLDLGKLGTDPLKMNSGMFVLPITNNMKIHLLSGAMDFTQVTALLPGAEVEVDKESVVTIYINPDESVFSGALVLYDSEQWGEYACGKIYNSTGMESGKYTKVVMYSPSWNGKPNVRQENTMPGDATVNVHGTFDTGQGAVFTTTGGANIFSSNEDAGTFIFSQNAPESISILPINNQQHAKEIVSAKLKNGNGEYTETTGSIAGMTYMYRDGAWRTSNPFVDGTLTYNSNCFTAEVNMMSYLGQVCDIDPSDPLHSPMNEDVKKLVAKVHASARMREYLLVEDVAQQNGAHIDPSQYEYLRKQYYAVGGDALKAFLLAQGSEKDLLAYAFVDQIPGFKEQAEDYNESYDFGSAVQTIYIKPQEWVEIAGTPHVQLAIDASYYNDLYDEGLEEGKSSDDYSKCSQAVNEYLNQDYIESNRMNPTIVGVDGNSDHTYSDAAGAGRLFILMEEGCQWWEVEKKANLYHCIHPDNDTYYYWGEDENGEERWLEKKFTISWKNWDGTAIVTNNGEAEGYEVTYGTMAEFLGTNPTREATNDYTYDFTGWSPALGPVTSDVTYTATYAQKDRMYTIIFQNEGGVEIERQFLKLNQVPVCENTPTKVGHTLVWSPAIAAVTGDATYTATWEEDPPTEYEITFFDYDGATVLQHSDVAVGTMPEYTGATPSGKPATSEYTYEFDHWAPALEEVSATSIKSYTAVYREVEKTYSISYYREDGETLNTTQELPYGATPTPPAVTKENPATGHTYTLVWKNLAETGTIQTVQGEASYKPTYIDELNKYTVTVKSNPSGACSSVGAGLYDYNTSATITLSVNDGYTFTSWSDGLEGTNTTRTITVTADKELVANFTVADPDYTITWNNEDGSLIYAQGQKANTATVFTGAIPTRSATADKTFTFYGWTTEQGGTDSIKNGLTPKATTNATYYAFFTKEPCKYTITWANEAGTANIEVDYNQPYGAAIAYNSATPTKAATADYTYTFDGWSASVGGNVVTLPETVTGEATFYAHFKQTTRTTLVVGINSTEEIAGATTINNLVITSNGIDASGQLLGAADLTINGNADYVLSNSFAGSTWYCVAVPWRVNVNGGIYLNASSTPAVLGTDFDICYYDGAIRAAQGKVDACWVYLKNLGSSQQVLQPGRAYMIALRNGASSITFRKKAQEPLLTTGTSVQQYPSAIDDTHAGWNAIANPALYHAYINAGSASSNAQKYIAGEDRYEWFELDDAKLIVGQPVYVQAPAAKSIVANTSTYSAAPAHRAQAEAQSTEFEVSITPAGASKYADHISVSMNEDKEENKYVIGQDLVKFGVSSKVAQMWINRYDAKLCVNTVAPVNGVAEYPLGIFAPTAGEYQISNANANANADLYLTLDGNAIWNLSDGAYVLNLNKGTVSNYGLRVSARAPQVVTGVDEAIVDAQGDTRKVLINNQVFIIRGEKVYTIDGRLVK